VEITQTRQECSKHRAGHNIFLNFPPKFEPPGRLAPSCSDLLNGTKYGYLPFTGNETLRITTDGGFSSSTYEVRWAAKSTFSLTAKLYLRIRIMSYDKNNNENDEFE